jgi:serine/threonine protein kinase
VEKSKFENKRIRPTKWMLCAVVDALKELHCQGIIHRDVKLDNIMLLSQQLDNKVCSFSSLCVQFGIFNST